MDKIIDNEIDTLKSVYIYYIKIRMYYQVVGFSELKDKSNQKNGIKQIIKNHDLFFCDERIYQITLQKHNKYFYEKKKYVNIYIYILYKYVLRLPFPIDCEKIP